LLLKAAIFFSTFRLGDEQRPNPTACSAAVGTLAASVIAAVIALSSYASANPPFEALVQRNVFSTRKVANSGRCRRNDASNADVRSHYPHQCAADGKNMNRTSLAVELQRRHEEVEPVDQHLVAATAPPVPPTAAAVAPPPRKAARR